MREIELKLRCGPAEEKKITAYCDRNGFARREKEVQEDVYLTPSHTNIYRKDAALRVRYTRSGDVENWAVTYKGPNSDEEFHSRREEETPVADGGVLLEIFRLMEFREVLVVKKERRSYVRDDVTISLDRLDGVGSFVEIERMWDGDPESAKAEIQKILLDIGIQDAAVEKKNYLQLVAESRAVEKEER